MYSPEVVGSKEVKPDFHFVLEDTEWLAKLGYSWPEEETQAGFNYLENVLSIASTPPNPYSSEPTDNQQAIIARNDFINGLTNLEDYHKHKLIERPELVISLSSFIGTQRILHDLDIDNQRVMRAFPAILSLKPEVLNAQLDNLKTIGIKPRRVINLYAPVLDLAPEEINFRIETINSLGLNALKVINIFPQILGMQRDTIKARMANLRKQGLDDHKLIESDSFILRYPTEAINAKLKFIKNMGLDMPRVVNVFPTTLSYAFSTLKLKFDNLTELGLDAVSCINNNPAIFSLAPETVKSRFEHLTRLGLNAVVVANRNPSVFSKSEALIESKMNNLTTLGLNAVKIVNARPAILNPPPETIKAKLRVLYSASRAWGLRNYKGPVNYFVESYPALLGYSSDRNRVLIRILNNSLDPHAHITLHQIRSLTSNNLEATLAAYLKQAKETSSLDQISEQSRVLYELGYQALQNLILNPEHANDSAVNVYQRSLARRASIAKHHQSYHTH